MPGRIKARVKNHDILGGLDLMATFASVGKVALPKNDREGKPIIFDSYDMSPVLFGTGKCARNEWFYFTEDELTPGAVRVGNSKAVYNLRGDDGQATGGLAVDSNLGWNSSEVMIDSMAHFFFTMTLSQMFSLWLSAALLLSGCSAQGSPTPSSSTSPSVVASGTAQAPAMTSSPTGQSDDPLALIEAAQNGNLPGVRGALGAGTDVNATLTDGRTALMAASFDGHTEVVAYLLEHGAKVDATDSVKRTALMFASSGPFPETVKMLLEKGADANHRDSSEGWTALMFAAAEGQEAVCKVLLEGGADSSLKDIDGDTALNHAKTNKHEKVVELLSR